MASPFPHATTSNGRDPDPDRLRTSDARLFGALRIVAPDGTNATPVGRKARALIAYLLLADGRSSSRDRLAALLWSDRGEDQARGSLRQTLYELRALATGDDALLSIDRAQVRIASSRVVTDLDRMQEAATQQDAAALAALIGDRPPDLLSDLDGADRAFDDWLAIERTRRSDERRRVVLAVGDRALAIDDAPGAHGLAVRLLACDGTDEAAACLAMSASHRLGDRDGVRRTYARLQEALQQELGAPPSDETTALHRRLMAAPTPSRPTIDPLHDATSAATRDALEAANDEPAPGHDPDPATTGTAAVDAPRAVRRRWSAAPTLIGTGVALVVLAIAGSIAWRSWVEPTQRVLFVEPMQVVEPGAQPRRIDLSADLARMIVGHDAALDVVDTTRRPAATGAQKGYFVEGDVQVDAQLLRADAKLLREKNGPILWSSTFTRPAAEFDALREQMASRLADVTTCALGSANPHADAFDAETLRLLFGACEQKHGDWNESARLLQQVVERQPEFAHGWAMLAAATAVTSDQVSNDTAALTAKVDDYARHALALDPHDGEAYFARALMQTGIARWSARQAILLAGHAVEPANAQIDAMLASDLALVGRWNEATVFSQRSVDADPFSAEKAAQRADLLGFNDGLSQVNVALQAARRRFGKDRSLTLAEFRIQALAGDPERAAHILADAERGFTLQGDRAALWKELIAARSSPSAAHDEAAHQAFVASMRAHPRVDLGTLEKLALLGRIDEAYAYAERLAPPLLDNEDTDQLFTSVMRPLRADPRFMTLSARLGLVPIWLQTDRWPDFCGDPALPYDCRVEARRATTAQARPLIATR